MKENVFFEFFKVTRNPMENIRDNILVVVFVVLFFMFLPFLLNAQNTTSEGVSSIAICEGDVLNLEDLNLQVQCSGGNEWWGTSGDGVFSPSHYYGAAEYYTPGVVDIQRGKVLISLNSCLNHEYTVTVYIQKDELFACNDNVTIPLGFDCKYEVKPPILLEGEEEGEPYNLYNVELRDEDNNLIPDNIVTGDYVGQDISFYISHECSYNACGGSITVQDNYRPVMSCANDTITCKIPIDPDDTLGFPIDTLLFTLDTIIRDSVNTNHYIVKGWDACCDVDLSYTDELKSFECEEDSVFQNQVIRRWRAVDANGNKSNCIDTIRIKRINVKEVNLPPDWNNIDTFALQCDGIWRDSALSNGYPSPNTTGWPEVWGCDIEYNYSDHPFEGCGNTFGIIRKWTVIDWCNLDSIITHNQIIKIVDDLAPQVLCNGDTSIVGTNPYEPSSERHKLQLPEVEDNCNALQIFVYVYDENNEEFPVQKSGNDFYVEDLPLGVYSVIFKAVDDCGNVGEGVDYLKVVDDQSPYAVCGEHHVVNLTSNGEARVYPESIDDGSFDNVGIESMQIRKMTYDCDSSYFEFGEYIGFCCEEVNTTIMVALKVIDFAGNSNSCMVEVKVKDKLPPQIVCPPDLHISCDYYFSVEDLSSYFGTVREDEDLVEDIVINDYFNSGVVGQDGYAYDNCSVSVTEEHNFDLSSCNVGNITRTFTASDHGGRTNMCQQIIEITNPTPFTEDGITWPENATFYGCSNLDADTSITGAPIFLDDACSMVATNYIDQLFSVEGDACKKIIRTWTVRDWCQSEEVKWTHEQHIMLFNEVAPVFTSDCQDREVCVYGQCRGQVELTATAEDDCTPSSELSWGWKLDEDNDGTYDDFGYNNNFSKVMEEGENRIVWTVEDKCGNISSCSYVFTVKDCKKPTPLCIENLSTAVMNPSGMVTVSAKDFNHFSYDNCTNSNYGECGCQTDLRFSFSQDVNDTLYNITCDSIYDGVERVFELKMWVTDNADNQDYCTVRLKVSDNNDVCEDTGQEGKVSLSGLFSKWSDDTPVSGIKVELADLDSEEIKYYNSDDNGVFKFDDLSKGDNYSVIPQDNKSNCLQGLTTFDIVQIQKHILSIKKFNSPYQYIAADVNENNKVTAADILYIRKIILGISENFKSKSCWEYVDAKQQLTIQEPHNFDKTIRINSMNSDVNDADFKVVKIGDVNDSYTLGELPEGLAYRGAGLELVVDDKTFVKGENVEVPVYTALDSDLEGVQFTIVFNKDNMSYEGFEAGQLELSSNNFGSNNVDSGILTFSWNDIGAKSLSKDSPLFSLKFKAKGQSSVIQDFSINSDVTKALSIVDDRELGVELRYRSDDDIEKFVVYQNTPNPFRNNTSIRFTLSKSQEVFVEVFDINGNLILSESRYFDKGINSFNISESELGAGGVYYYSVKTSEGTITKKMIFVD